VQLDQLRLQLRRRTEWEALELGRAMLREWRAPVYRAWSATFIPFAVVVTLALWPWPDISGLVLWWSKPVFDRVLLHVFSQCTFGVQPTVRQVYRALPSILRRSGLLAWLTVYRLSPARSFLLPIWLLERQRGAAARTRGRLLRHRAGSYAAWLTATCAAMSAVLYVSQVLLFETLVPTGQEGLFSWDRWTDGSLSHTAFALLGLFAASAASVTEPLYIASGFSLYLNRRAELEAWDVELRFRSLAERRSRSAAGSSTTRAVVVTVALVALAATTMGAQGARSVSPPRTPVASKAPSPVKRVVLDVLRDPVFGTEREVLEWRPKNPPQTNSRPLPQWLRWLPAALAMIATAGRYLVGIAAGVALAWLLLRLQRRAGPTVLPGGSSAREVLFGLDVRPESLPADLRERARRLALDGDVTAALALLYRGALVSLVHHAGVRFADGDTERDCLRRAADALQGSELAYFATLVRSWQQAAYAHDAPPQAAVLRLCDAWPVSFAGAESHP
jgi:hypothetical protein